MMLDDLSRLFINDFQYRYPILETNNADIIKINYELNNFGYRGNDFSNNTKMLALGCSQTYGAGLPYDEVWISILAKKLNFNFSNLARSGESTMIQVMRAFYYFEKFGNPEIIVGLFPIYRMPTVFVPGKLEKFHGSKHEDIRMKKWKKVIENTDLAGDKFQNYSKAPHNPESVLPKEMALFYDVTAIDMLRQYCKTNNIKFIWSVWDMSYQESIYRNINHFYPEHHKDYCQVEAFNWKIPNSRLTDLYGEYNALDCHNEYRENDFFYKAADRLSEGLCHWGLHKNIHIAEDFYNHMIATGLN